MNVKATATATARSPFYEILAQAHIHGLRVKLRTATGRRYRYETHRAAQRIISIHEEPRRGTVIVLSDLERIRLADVIGAEVIAQ